MEKLKVLIVDDELGMRRGSAKVLKKTKFYIPETHTEIGFITDEAIDGEQAVQKLREQDYDLALLDYKMPGLSGLDVLDFIRENKIEVLPVMVTAYASLEVAVSATKNGAFDFLAKPFSPEELKNVVQKSALHLISQRQAKKMAEEKRRVRFQFISVLSHELKAPIAAVYSYLQLMKRHIYGEDLSPYDQMIERSIIRLDGMRKMIFDLLDLTRLESGQKKREIKQVNITEVAKNSIEMIGLSATEREIAIILSADDNINIWGDPGELEIVFNNLISNAVKYNRDKGRVEVVIRPGNDEVVVTVKDTGFGMTPEEQERLFGEFVRIKNEHTRNVLGSGLGLSILKRIVTLYHGKIDVESEKDVGTTFTVTLKNQKPEENTDNDQK